MHDSTGTFNLTKAAAEYLKASKGAIINVSATLHYNGLPYQQHAGSAKAGIDVSFSIFVDACLLSISLTGLQQQALTKHWAVELGPHGVRK